MKRILLLGAACFVLLSARTQTILTGEYWIDQDPGLGQALPIIIQHNGANEAFSISIGNNLAEGVHVIGIRTKDDEGHWSHTNFTRSLVHAPVTPSGNISAIEWFFNEDPGFGAANQIAPTQADNIIDEPIESIAALPVGVNLLFCRSRSDNGEWSLTNKRPVLVAAPDAAETEVVGVETFWDSDPGFGAANYHPAANPAADIVDLLALVDVPADLDVETSHVLFVRSLSSDGRWSHTNRQASIDVTGVHVEDLEAKSGISAFPNPFTEGITVKTEDGLPVRVVLHDPQGKLVYDRVITGNAWIDLSQEAAGSYTAFFWKDLERMHRVSLVKQ